LSKFGQNALDFLGFGSFTEAFNALGFGLGAKPASIKNYRDELDPFFPNARMGWHRRPLREHCRRVLDAYKDAPISELGSLVQRLIRPVEYLDAEPEVLGVLDSHRMDATSSFAKRLITGRAAEQYFVARHKQMPEFAGLHLVDTTAWGCGFDFKLMHPEGQPYCVIEVKGMSGKHGHIELTALEYDMAAALNSRYFLVLVRNFCEAPFHTVVNNPVCSALHFDRKERKETRLSWQANVQS
jgi:hypothetical protein